MKSTQEIINSDWNECTIEAIIHTKSEYKEELHSYYHDYVNSRFMSDRLFDSTIDDDAYNKISESVDVLQTKKNYIQVKSILSNTSETTYYINTSEINMISYDEASNEYFIQCGYFSCSTKDNPLTFDTSDNMISNNINISEASIHSTDFVKVIYLRNIRVMIQLNGKNNVYLPIFKNSISVLDQSLLNICLRFEEHTSDDIVDLMEPFGFEFLESLETRSSILMLKYKIYEQNTYINFGNILYYEDDFKISNYQIDNKEWMSRLKPTVKERTYYDILIG